MVLQPNLMHVFTFYGLHFLLVTFTFLLFFSFLSSLCVVWGLNGVVVHLRFAWSGCPLSVFLYCCGRRYVRYVSRCASSVSWAPYVFLYHRLDRSICCIVSLGPGVSAGSAVVTVFVSSSERVVLCSPLLCCIVLLIIRLFVHCIDVFRSGLVLAA